MKRNLYVLFALIVALFTLPLGMNSVLADSTYDVQDGEYEVDIDALHETEDKDSAAAGFIADKATLSVQGDDIILTVGVAKPGEGDSPFGDADFDIKWIKIEGDEPTAENEDDQLKYFEFQLNSLKDMYNAQIRYVVPDFPTEGQDMDHSPDFRLKLNGLDDLPEPEAAGDENNEENDDGNENENNNENTNENNNNGNNDGNNNEDDNNDGAVEENDENNQEENPQTGDSSNIMLYSILLFGAILVATIVMVRKRSAE